jgi:hypothetical protein
MAKSVKQLQDEVLGYLDSIGQDASAFKDVNNLPGIERMLVLSAANFIQKVQENLNASGRVNTGALSSDLEEGQVESGGGSVSISVGYPASSKAAKYYDFVNKGVSGTSNKIDSPYSFKNNRVGGPMRSAIEGWLKNNSLSSRNETQKKNLSSVQRKRKRLSKMVNANSKQKSLAYAVATSIKKKGLKKTGFVDKAADFAFGKDFADAVAKIIGREIAVNIRINGNNNR